MFGVVEACISKGSLMLNPLCNRALCIIMAYGICALSGCSTAASAIPNTTSYISTASSESQPLTTIPLNTTMAAGTYTSNTQPINYPSPFPISTMPPMPEWSAPPIPTATAADVTANPTNAPSISSTRKPMSILAGQQLQTAAAKHKKHCAYYGKKKYMLRHKKNTLHPTS